MYWIGEDGCLTDAEQYISPIESESCIVQGDSAQQVSPEVGSFVWSQGIHGSDDQGEADELSPNIKDLYVNDSMQEEKSVEHNEISPILLHNISEYAT